MSPRLVGFVHVRTEDGRMVVFGPDDTVPGWALAQMDDGCFTGAGPRTSAAAGEPPRAGKGSSRQAWAEYAAASGIEVPDEMSRDDIIAEVDRAHAAG